MTDLLSTVIAIVFAVTVHEFCHAWVANRLGDPTPRVLGRLTLNPLKHFDLVGTLALIFFGFGWGKPVPFNPANLRYPKRDSALIALAGPMANLITAIVFAIPLKYLSTTSLQSMPIYSLLGHIFGISVLLFSLNILPFPPFDGSKIIGIFVPRKYIPAYEEYLQKGVMYVIIFILFDSFILTNLVGFSLLGMIISYVTTWVIAIISLAT